MFSALMPKDHSFFDLFDQMCVHTVDGIEILVKMLEKGREYHEPAEQLKLAEKQSDGVVHQVILKLHKTFVTPLDRDDIFLLVNRLDDILDLSEGAASRISLYQPKQVPPEVIELAMVLLEGAKRVKEMIGLLRNLKKSTRIIELTVEIKHFENKADFLRRSLLARLFREEKDVCELIKWKDILDLIEKGTDRCDDVANITEGIVLENT